MCGKIVILLISLGLLQAQAASFRPKSRHLIQGRIAGGKDATKGQFPYSVALADASDLSYYLCGGSIITNRYILTAADCAQTYQLIGPSDLRVFLNTASRDDTDSTTIEIAEVYAHEEFIPQNAHHNIAIMLTLTEIMFNRFIQPVRLPTMDQQFSGADAVIAGWGLLAPSDIFKDPEQQPQKLQSLQTSILTANDCRSKFGQLVDSPTDDYWLQIDAMLNETFICTRNNVGAGTCTADAGNGVIVDNTIVGVVSLSFGVGYPNVHTNVYAFMGWIETHMKRLTDLYSQNH